MLSPQFILPIHSELVIDLFAGGGGASTGIEQAIGRHVDIAINHDPEAVALHQANHPQTKHYVSDVFEVDPVAVVNGRKVGMLWASPDCFPAGTLVMTDKGYRAIESIKVGDRVLTHQLRWRAVTECSSTVRPLIEIRGHGHPGLRVSPEHPFYSREQYRTWNNDRRSYDYALKAPEWMPASGLQKGLYWGTPCTFPESVAPDVAGRGIDMTNELLWLAGRYVGDGWTRLTDTRSEVVITCGKHEIEHLRVLLNRWPRTGGRAVANELEWHERHTSTAYQFTTNHRGLVQWLREHFGHRSEAKGIPAWALGLSVAARESLLEGYLSADGHKFDDFVEAHTVSKSLAFGIKALVNSLGKTVAVYCGPNSTVIQGRKVNARDLFKVRWRHAVHSEHTQTYIEDGIEWCPVREQTPMRESAEVFNIGVEEDESYVVEGVIVHNCKHFSKAKGGKPVSKKIRGLAWVVIKWAKLVRPRVIFLENVEEFQTWGPLIKKTVTKISDTGESYTVIEEYPCPEKKGRTFKRWKSTLENLGYKVDFREDRASDMGAPTIRKRLFLVARCDGHPIVFPEATHGAPQSLPVKQKKLKPFRTAAECIQWDIEAPSIFERKKELAEATKRRIAKGIMRYVVESANPFIVPLTHQGGDRTESITQPFNTITGANRGEKALIVPTLVQTGYGERQDSWRCAACSFVYGRSDLPVCGCSKCGSEADPVLVPGQSPRSLDLHKPLGTVVAGQKHALVTAFLNEHAQSSNQRVMPIDEPLRTQMAEVKGGHFSLVAASLVKNYTGAVGSAMNDPIGTVTSVDHHSLLTANLVHYQADKRPEDVRASDMREPLKTQTTENRHGLVTAHLTKFRSGSTGSAMDEPVHTVTAGGDPARPSTGNVMGMVTANLVHMGHGEAANGAKRWSHGIRDVQDPLNTITASGMPAALVTSNMIKLRGENVGSPTDEPLHTISAQGTHHAEVRAFLVKYYSTDQDPNLEEPLHTITTKDRFGLVTVKGQQYQIVDIGLRMLTPRELYRAQGFPESYQIERGGDGQTLTKTAQVRMCGNSVCPPMAKAYVLANYREIQPMRVAA